jgi:hypothetical protein
MLRWDRCGFHKKRAGRRYDQLVFLHLVGSTGHIVHSGVTGRVMSMHYFLSSGELDAVSIKKRSQTRYAELVFLNLVGSTGHIGCDTEAPGKSEVRAHILAWAYYLYAFSSYPLCTWLPSVYRRHDNWYTRGASFLVLSY